MLINNYGLFWRLDQVHWGRQKNKGTLLGRRALQKRTGAVDFREQKGIYVLYDDVFQIVYLGQAGGRNEARLFNRLKVHKRDHLAQRWSRFSWFGICPVKGKGIDADYRPAKLEVRAALDHIEGILLAAAEPPLNLQRGRFGREVEHYLQVPLDEHHDIDLEEALTLEDLDEDEIEIGG